MENLSSLQILVLAVRNKLNIENSKERDKCHIITHFEGLDKNSEKKLKMILLSEIKMTHCLILKQTSANVFLYNSQSSFN